MNQNFEDVRNIVKDIIDRRWINTVPAIKDDFIKITFAIRFLVCMNEGQVKSIWNGIRINETLSDFVIDTTREFLIRCFSSEYTYQTLCREISESFGWLTSHSSCIDDDLLKSTAPVKNVEEILIGNPWLTLLYICEGLIVMEDTNG